MLASERANIADGETKPILKTEQELILECQQGNRQSFRLLYQTYQKRVRSTLYQLCGKHMLDDLVQEVFFRAWKGLPKLSNVEYFSTWLYRISWNVAIDRRRKLARNRDLNNTIDPAIVEMEVKANPAVTSVQEAPDLMHLHYQDLVQRGLDSLSFQHRAVLVLHDLEDIPQKQVAKILDVPLGTVKSRLFHARNSLKKFLQNQGISL